MELAYESGFQRRLPCSRRSSTPSACGFFGSRLSGPLHQASDVDLAVEGVAAHRHFEAAAAVEGALGVPVDLVRMEDASAPLSARVLAEGAEL